VASRGGSLLGGLPLCDLLAEDLQLVLAVSRSRRDAAEDFWDRIDEDDLDFDESDAASCYADVEGVGSFDDRCWSCMRCEFAYNLGAAGECVWCGAASPSAWLQPPACTLAAGTDDGSVADDEHLARQEEKAALEALKEKLRQQRAIARTP